MATAGPLTALLNLPVNEAHSVALALELGLLCPPWSRTMVGQWVRDERVAGVTAALVALDATGASGRSSAAWLRALVTARQPAPRPTLVWSGPHVPGLHERETDRVWEDLFATACESLWISTFKIYNGKALLATLAQRMEAVTDLAVNMVLHVDREPGDDRPVAAIAATFGASFKAKDWPPGARLPRLWHFPRSLELESANRASMHAKVVVADGYRVLVTSANLTDKAGTVNVEAGVVTDDRVLATSILAHFRGLVDHGHLVPLPV